MCGLGGDFCGRKWSRTLQQAAAHGLVLLRTAVVLDKMRWPGLRNPALACAPLTSVPVTTPVGLKGVPVLIRRFATCLKPFASEGPRNVSSRVTLNDMTNDQWRLQNALSRQSEPNSPVPSRFDSRGERLQEEAA